MWVVAFFMLAQPVSAHTYTPGDTVVSLVTFYPGGEVFELEGHTALRVQTPQADVAVNWGMFSFNEPGFVYRFVKGETDYWTAALWWPSFAEAYRAEGRRIVERRLNLTADQKARLLALLDENLRPENATYRYNYVRDNCATRPLRIVERALGDSIVLGPAPAALAGDDVTFRRVMEHYHANYPWYQFGIDLCLGPGMDTPVSNRERAFAPAMLDIQIATATVGGKPLVAATEVNNDVPEDAAVLAPTPWYLTPLAAAWLLFAIAALLTVRDVRRLRVSRWFDSVLFATYGFLGLIITYLVFCSSHEATSPNYLVFWLNPLCFLPAVCVWIKRARGLVMCYYFANFAVLMALCLLWPLTGQKANAAFIPMVAAELVRTGSYLYINLKTRKSVDAKQ